MFRRKREAEAPDERASAWRVWNRVGISADLNRAHVRRAQRQALIAIPLFAGALVVYAHRNQFVGHAYALPVRIGTVVVLLVLGWLMARDIGRAAAPLLSRRLEPATAGTVAFLIRLVTVAIAVVLALYIAGLRAGTLVAGGAATAVVLGLAAQQTLGHIIAGTVLISARPFRVGQRVRLHAGPLGGQVEGRVASLGLLFTTLITGEDRLMIPNSMVLNAGVVPLTKPDSVELQARLPVEVTPREVQEVLERDVEAATRSDPDITLQAVEGDDVILHIAATPEDPASGAQLADEILHALARVAGSDDGAEAAPGGRETASNRA